MLFLLWVTAPATAQFVPGGRALSLSQSMTARSDAEWALFGNPAMLRPRGISASFYGGRYYGLPELTDLAAGLSFGRGSHSWAVGLLRYGDDRFHDTRLRSGYAISLGVLSIGTAVQYRLMGFGGGYGSLGMISVDGGVSVRISEDLILGSRINPVYVHAVRGIAADTEQEMALGMSYRFAEVASFSLDAVKDLRYPISFRSGMEYRPLKVIVFRAGFSTEPEIFSGGIGLILGSIRINAGVQRHWLLGLSPGMDVGLDL